MTFKPRCRPTSAFPYGRCKKADRGVLPPNGARSHQRSQAMASYRFFVTVDHTQEGDTVFMRGGEAGGEWDIIKELQTHKDVFPKWFCEAESCDTEVLALS